MKALNRSLLPSGRETGRENLLDLNRSDRMHFMSPANGIRRTFGEAQIFDSSGPNHTVSK